MLPRDSSKRADCGFRHQKISNSDFEKGGPGSHILFQDNKASRTDQQPHAGKSTVDIPISALNDQNRTFLIDLNPEVKHEDFTSP